MSQMIIFNRGNCFYKRIVVVKRQFYISMAMREQNYVQHDKQFKINKVATRDNKVAVETIKLQSGQ